MEETKSSIRQRADEIKEYQCKNLITVLENPMDIKNIGSVIRNANALGVEKIYVVDSRKSLPDDWSEWGQILTSHIKNRQCLLMALSSQPTT